MSPRAPLHNPCSVAIEVSCALALLGVQGASMSVAITTTSGGGASRDAMLVSNEDNPDGKDAEEEDAEGPETKCDRLGMLESPWHALWLLRRPLLALQPALDLPGGDQCHRWW